MKWLVLFVFCSNVVALDVGTYGSVYEIAERDALDWIYNERLPELERSGEIEKMQKNMQAKAVRSVKRPKGVKLPKVVEPNIRKKNLVVKVGQDIHDADGNLLVVKGSKFNPFENLPDNNKTLVFIDGDDNVQVNWAVEEYNKNKETHVVLIQGKPIEIARARQVPIYFDQSQAYISRFGIERVPTKLYRQGHNLYIEEIVLGEDDEK
jgi:conjugal transfer pilus assembly protein TraW